MYAVSIYKNVYFWSEQLSGFCRFQRLIIFWPDWAETFWIWFSYKYIMIVRNLFCCTTLEKYNSIFILGQLESVFNQINIIYYL